MKVHKFEVNVVYDINGHIKNELFRYDTEEAANMKARFFKIGDERILDDGRSAAIHDVLITESLMEEEE